MASEPFDDAVSDGKEGVGERIPHGSNDVVEFDDMEFPLSVGGGSHGEISVSSLMLGNCNCVETRRTGNRGQECTAAGECSLWV